MSHGITRKDIVLHKASTCWHGLAEVEGDTFSIDRLFATDAFKFDLTLARVALVLPDELVTHEAHAKRVLDLAKRFGIDPEGDHDDVVLNLLAELAKYELQESDRYSIRLDENGEWMRYGSPITDKYTHFTQSDAYATLIDLERKLGGELKLSSGGTLYQGARCWAQGTLADQDFEITTRLGTKFGHVANFTMMWGHDGRTPVLFLGNDTDIVCWNTSEFALSENKARISIPHTSGVHEAVEAAVKVLAEMPGAIDENRRVLQDLAETDCTEAEFRKYAEAVVLGVDDYKSKDERDERIAEAVMEKRPISDGGKAKTSRALSLFEKAVDEYVAEFRRRALGDSDREPGAGFTMYAADAAFSAVIDHPTERQSALDEIRAAGGVEAYVKKSKDKYKEAVATIRSVSRAAESAMVGSGAEVKRRARAMLLRSGGVETS